MKDGYKNLVEGHDRTLYFEEKWSELMKILRKWDIKKIEALLNLLSIFGE